MKPKILIVDDSQTTRTIIRQELEHSGFNIFEAENGLEAIQKAEEIRPQLITMDVDMPEMNGFEAVYKIRTELQLTNGKTNQDVPIIFITANDTIQGRRRGYEVGATDFIIKPFVRGEVASCVDKLLKPGGNLEGTTVLIVEDSNLSLGILNGILQGEGVTTILAEDGKEAFEIFKAEEQTIDLVLTDFVMSEMNGDELCRKIRKELGNQFVPIIIISGISESSFVLDLFKTGASDYIVKPFAKEELLARVRAHLKSSLLNKQLSNQVKELKRLSKLKDEFLSITSHDLRSPLNGIIGFTDLVMQDVSIGEQNIEFLQRIKDSGDFLLNLINDILDLGRVQSEHHSLEMQPIAIPDIIEASVSTVLHMASPKGINLVTQNKCINPPIIEGDKNALVRIFSNLLSNAIKFTPKGGEVRQIIQETESNRLSISIVDTGIGIAPDQMPFLFDKFSKASRPGTAGEKSTGLGLSITKALVERHNGSIDVDSEVEKGTCFKILFPLMVDPGTGLDELKKSEDTIEIDPVMSSHPIRILIADDNKLNVKLVEMMLSKKGYVISTALDGKEAFDKYVKALNNDENPVDIIFMDLRMPVMDGFEATEQIRKYEIANMLSHTPIVAMTAGTDGTWQIKSQEKGLNGFVTKPVTIQKIQEVIGNFFSE